MYSLPVRGKAERLPVNRIFLVGRNYHAHALEMGRPVDKSVEVPFYFTKAPGTLVESGFGNSSRKLKQVRRRPPSPSVPLPRGRGKKDSLLPRSLSPEGVGRRTPFSLGEKGWG